MSRFFTVDRLLMVCAVAWLATLLREPDLQEREDAFYGSVGLIALNALVSFWTLTRRRSVLIGLNCTQIVLFGVLNYQLFRTYGEEHYLFDRQPEFYDWVEFTAAHVLRAADVFDGLDEYGINLQNISHNSTAAGCILVCMHVVVDVFLIGLLIRWAESFRQSAPKGTALARARKDCGWLLATLALYVGFAASQQLEPHDWLLWPLDNLLRLMDIGDMFQIFHWQLHSVDADPWTSTAAVLFRLAAGIWMTRIVLLLRLTVFRTWGLSIDQLTALLAEGNTQERRGAANGLGWSGPAAAQAVPALAGALRDFDFEVRCNAARALGKIGPTAKKAVEALADALWRQPRQLRFEAAQALGRIGREAKPAVRDIQHLLRVSDDDNQMQETLTRALEQIAPSSQKQTTEQGQAAWPIAKG